MKTRAVVFARAVPSSRHLLPTRDCLGEKFDVLGERVLCSCVKDVVLVLCCFAGNAVRIEAEKGGKEKGLNEDVTKG